MNVTMKQVEGGVCAAAGFSANGLNCGLNPDRNLVREGVYGSGCLYNE